MIENIVIAVILIGIIGGILYYLRKAKKRGDACVGCPYARSCKKGEGCGTQKKD